MPVIRSPWDIGSNLAGVPATFFASLAAANKQSQNQEALYNAQNEAYNNQQIMSGLGQGLTNLVTVPASAYALGRLFPGEENAPLRNLTALSLLGRTMGTQAPAQFYGRQQEAAQDFGYRQQLEGARQQFQWDQQQSEQDFRTNLEAMGNAAHNEQNFARQNFATPSQATQIGRAMYEGARTSADEAAILSGTGITPQRFAGYSPTRQNEIFQYLGAQATRGAALQQAAMQQQSGEMQAKADQGLLDDFRNNRVQFSPGTGLPFANRMATLQTRLMENPQFAGTPAAEAQQLQILKAAQAAGQLVPTYVPPTSEDEIIKSGEVVPAKNGVDYWVKTKNGYDLKKTTPKDDEPPPWMALPPDQAEIAKNNSFKQHSVTDKGATYLWEPKGKKWIVGDRQSNQEGDGFFSIKPTEVSSLAKMYLEQDKAIRELNMMGLEEGERADTDIPARMTVSEAMRKAEADLKELHRRNAPLRQQQSNQSTALPLPSDPSQAIDGALYMTPRGVRRFRNGRLETP